MKAFTPKKLIFYISFILFLALLPAANYIDFYQNDDWVYYQQIERFHQGDFRLLPLIAPTFYVQGVLGFLFTKVMDLSKLPILTLLVSVANFTLVCLILKENVKKTLGESILLGMLLFTCPLYVYSIFGFMTENYFLFFLLLAFYFFSKNYFLTNLMGIMAFFVKQVGLAFPASLCLYYFANKDYKKATIQLAITVGLLLFYIFLFPKTEEMVTKPMVWTNLADLSIVRSWILGILLMLTAFTIPLVLTVLAQPLYNKGLHPKIAFKNIAIFIFTGIVFFLVFSRYFHPEKTYIREFPYFGNTLVRNGFFKSEDGTKYGFRGIFALYKYWDLIAKTTLILFVSSRVTFYKKQKVSVYVLFILVYTPVILVSERLYDRYYMVLIPIFIFFLADLLPTLDNTYKTIISLFVLSMAFISYQFTADYLMLNKYMWQTSREIVIREKIEPKLIKGPNAWKLAYRNIERNYKYIWSYDSPRINDELAASYNLIQTYEVKYPANIFIEPKIYLWKLK